MPVRCALLANGSARGGGSNGYAHSHSVQAKSSRSKTRISRAECGFPRISMRRWRFKPARRHGTRLEFFFPDAFDFFDDRLADNSTILAYTRQIQPRLKVLLDLSRTNGNHNACDTPRWRPNPHEVRAVPGHRTAQQSSYRGAADGLRTVLKLDGRTEFTEYPSCAAYPAAPPYAKLEFVAVIIPRRKLVLLQSFSPDYVHASHPYHPRLSRSFVDGLRSPSPLCIITESIYYRCRPDGSLSNHADRGTGGRILACVGERTSLMPDAKLFSRRG
ncbi:hypothetical protein C8R47DRAFT_305798 [Mycena vitilis]|nr:hypothetical protein C8R47DRAFT_305798 [Mycena vitilis]